MDRPTVGVLALQGGFASHLRLLETLGIRGIEIRKPEDLRDICGLILPGGESTTVHHLLATTRLDEAIKNFSQQYPIMGTCAGLILMARKVLGNFGLGLDLLDVVVQRNAYGRQLSSFYADIEYEEPLTGLFIRAPQIVAIGTGVRVLATHRNRPVIVDDSTHIATTFHPELTQCPTLHKRFLQRCVKALSVQ